jgi:cytochrome c peroxidase
MRETKRIPTTHSPLPAVIRRGKLLFFSSHTPDLSRDRWMSCASCHFDGEHDGRTWMFTAGPRNTTSLRGAVDTLPLHWSADRNEIQDFEFTKPNAELAAPNAGRSADLDALAAYVLSLQMKPSPWAGDVGRGRAIFNRADVGCATCHRAPLYTDSTLSSVPYLLHDVGTGDAPEERLGPAFDTPSLRGVWDTSPYLHDGSAATLRDVLVTRNANDRHGHTSQLSESELTDLIAFLKSL